MYAFVHFEVRKHDSAKKQGKVFIFDYRSERAIVYLLSEPISSYVGHVTKYSDPSPTTVRCTIGFVNTEMDYILGTVWG